MDLPRPPRNRKVGGDIKSCRILSKIRVTGFYPVVKRAVIISLRETREQQTPSPPVLSLDMDAECIAKYCAWNSRRDKTRAIKQGMMQQLLTGSVRYW